MTFLPVFGGEKTEFKFLDDGAKRNEELFQRRGVIREREGYLADTFLRSGP